MSGTVNLKSVPATLSNTRLELGYVDNQQYARRYCAMKDSIIKSVTFEITSCQPTGSPSTGSPCECRIIEQ